MTQSPIYEHASPTLTPQAQTMVAVLYSQPRALTGVVPARTAVLPAEAVPMYAPILQSPLVIARVTLLSHSYSIPECIY